MWRVIKIHCPYFAPDELRATPQVGVDDVPVQVEGHARGGMSKHPLHHLRVSPRTQPDRRRAVPKIVHPQTWPTDHLLGVRPSDRPLPVLLAQRRPS